MSKEELLALAREGKAQIEETMSYVVTRYWIGEPAKSKDLDGPAIRVELSEFGVESAFYHAEGEGLIDLTDAEADTMAEAIGVSLDRD